LQPRPERGVGQGTFSTPLAGGSVSVLVSTPSLYFGDTTMPGRLTPPIDPLDGLPQLPLTAAQWKYVVMVLRLSPQQAKIVELVLRSAGNRQIAEVLGLREPTVRTYLERIFSRTGTRDRMELAMRVLAASHDVHWVSSCPPKG
jgi:two-component system nitrate/nitrite response regulator NarL